MNVLYIYAHQEPASFNAALKAVAVETFEKTGHNVKVSDLYAMHFKPVLDANDFMQRKSLKNWLFFLSRSMLLRQVLLWRI